MKWFIKLALHFDYDILLTKDKAWLKWTQRDIELRFTSPDIPPSATTHRLRIDKDQSNSQIYRALSASKSRNSAMRDHNFLLKGYFEGHLKKFIFLFVGK